MDPFPNLPEPIARSLLSRLFRDLPPPRDESPDARHIRDVLAMAAIANLGPVNLAEAELAVHAIVCRAQAMDCVGAANELREDFQRASQCRAQSALMMRQAAQALKELRTTQRERDLLLLRRDMRREMEARGTQANGMPANGMPANEMPAKGVDANGTEARGADARVADTKGTESRGAEVTPPAPPPDSPVADIAASTAAGSAATPWVAPRVAPRVAPQVAPRVPLAMPPRTTPRESQDMIQHPTSRDHETPTTALPLGPLPDRDDRTLIRTLLSGTAEAAWRTAHPGR